MSTTAPELSDVRSVVEEVWSSYVGAVEPLVPRPVPPGTPFDSEHVWSAAVSVAGGWHGVVTVEMTEQVARALSSSMLDLAPGEEPAEADIADAVGEIANMVGGNIKSLVPGPSTLSLPAVAAGRAAFPSGSLEVARLDVLWAREPLRVSVHTPPTTDWP